MVRRYFQKARQRTWNQGFSAHSAAICPPRDSDGAIQKRVTRDSNPVVTLTIGQVTIDLADQVEKTISGYVDRNLAAMEERLSRPQRPAPNSQGATE